MPVVTGGLFALGASGTIAKTLTYSRWKGIRYTRQRVIPANPQSTNQRKIRNVFTALSNYWRSAENDLRTPWESAVAGKPLTARNLLVQANASNFYYDGTLDQMVASPGDPGIPPTDVVTLTPGSHEIAVSTPNQDPPPGWVGANMYGLLIPQADPATPGVDIPPHTLDIQVGTHYTNTFTGLTTGVVYQVMVWYSYTKSGGITTYTRSSIAHAAAA